MIDKRVIERQIRKGKLDAASHQRTLEGLPDLADRVARDTGEEPTRSVAVAAPREPSSGGYASAPDAEDLDDDEDDDEDDLDDEGEEEGDDETPEAPVP